jgi:hypothetical protein
VLTAGRPPMARDGDGYAAEAMAESALGWAGGCTPRCVRNGGPMRTHRPIVVVAAVVVAVVWSMAAIGPVGGRVDPDTCALPSIWRERAGTGALASAGEVGSYDD